MYPVEKLLDVRNVLGHHIYLVKWEGYPLGEASWELEEAITEDVVEQFWTSRGSGDVLEWHAFESTLATSKLSLDPTVAQQRELEMIDCGTFKYRQKGTPVGGHLRRSKGVQMAVRSCNIIVGFGEMFGSESLSQVVHFLLTLFYLCPQMLQELQVLCYDDMCHLRTDTWSCVAAAAAYMRRCCGRRWFAIAYTLRITSWAARSQDIHQKMRRSSRTVAGIAIRGASLTRRPLSLAGSLAATGGGHGGGHLGGTGCNACVRGMRTPSR
jgi:hypothetical protein